MRERESLPEGPDRNDDTFEELERFFKESGAAEYMEGESLPKYALNEIALRELPETMPESARIAEAEIEAALKDDTAMKEWKEKPHPKPETLREQKMREKPPPHESQDLYRKAVEILGEKDEAVFDMDEDVAGKLQLKGKAHLRKSGKAYSLFVETEAEDDRDAGKIFKAIKFKLWPDTTELVFAIGNAETNERIDAPLKLPKLTDAWHQKIATILGALRA